MNEAVSFVPQGVHCINLDNEISFYISKVWFTLMAASLQSRIHHLWKAELTINWLKWKVFDPISWQKLFGKYNWNFEPINTITTTTTTKTTSVSPISCNYCTQNNSTVHQKLQYQLICALSLVKYTVQAFVYVLQII